MGFSFGDSVLGRQIGTPFSGGFRVSSQCFGMLAGREHAYLLTGGHWDNSFQCVSVADGKTVRSICQHNDVVTCLSGKRGRQPVRFVLTPHSFSLAVRASVQCLRTAPE